MFNVQDRHGDRVHVHVGMVYSLAGCMASEPRGRKGMGFSISTHSVWYCFQNTGLVVQQTVRVLKIGVHGSG